jgi:MGT family glycosyltransferase
VPEHRADEVISGHGHLHLVTVARSFQCFGQTFGDDHVFVGPCLDPPGEGDRAGWRPGPGGGPVALISLGTTVNERPELFRRCAEAFGGTDWQVVMTVGGRLDPASLGPLPRNVEVQRWLPHAEVLRHARVFVCQGGMGSVQESLAHAVPMVVVAQHHEQRANAERIAELGLGHQLATESLTAEMVRDAVLRVATDPEIARRTRAMHDDIQAAGGAARAARAILDHTAKSVTP